MKAIQFEQYGEPVKVLTVQERPVPEPGKGEVRVVFWLGYWFFKFDETARHQLVQDVVTLMRDGILVTSTAARTFSLDEIRTAVTQAESIGRQGKVLLVPKKQ